jgi:hypothetical protein
VDDFRNPTGCLPHAGVLGLRDDPDAVAGTGSPMATGGISCEPRSIRSWYGSTLMTLLHHDLAGPGARSGRRSGTRSLGRSSGPGRCFRTMASVWLGMDMSNAFACGRQPGELAGGLTLLGR